MITWKSWIRLRSHGFLGSVGIIVSGTGAAAVISALTLPILTRIYTPHDFSLLAVLTSITSIISVIACLRFDLAIPVPERDDEAANLLGLALVSLVCVVCLLSGLLLLAPASALEFANQSWLEHYLWLLPSGVALTALSSALQHWLVRKGDFVAIAQSRVLQAGAMAGAQGGGGLFNGMQLGLLLGPIIGAGASCAALAYRIANVDKDLARKVSWVGIVSAFRSYNRFPKYSVLEALTNTSGIQLPILLIASLATAPEAGLLMLAMTVIQAPMGLLGMAVGQVFLSRAPHEFRAGKLSTFTATILGTLLRTGVGPLVLAGVLAPDLFAKVFGEEWRRAGVLMAWMTPWFMAQFLASPVSVALLAINKQREALYLQVFGAITRVAAVYFASIVAVQRVSEVYALSGFFFYSVYLLVVLVLVGVRPSDLWIETRKAAPILLVWTALSLLSLLVYDPIVSWF